MVDRLSLSAPQPAKPAAPPERPAPPAPGIPHRSMARDQISLTPRETGPAEPAPAKPVPKPPAKPTAPARTAQDMRRDAEVSWSEWRGWTPPADWRRVESNPRDVNAPSRSPKGLEPAGGKGPRPSWAADIDSQLARNQALEKEAIANMTPEQAAMYQRLAAATEGHPDARLAVQLMLGEGTLTRQEARGRTVLAALDGLVAQPLAEGLDRGELLGELVQELAIPQAIAQRGVGTCTVATLQILVAREQPAEYVRLVAGLASPEGEVRMANGDTLRRSPGTEQGDPWGRSVPSRLWQPALMEYANGDAITYDNASGRHSDSTPESERIGLYAHEVDRAMEGLIGRDVETVSVYDAGDEAKRALVARIEAQLGAGVPVPVALAWGLADAEGTFHVSHEILVTEVKDGRIFYCNPWGQKESMAVEELQQRIQFASLGGAATEPDWEALRKALEEIPEDAHMDHVEFDRDRYQGRTRVIG